MTSRKKITVIIFLAIVVVIAAIAFIMAQDNSNKPESKPKKNENVSENTESKKENLQQKKVNEILSGMSTEEKIGQLFFVRPKDDDNSVASVGGIILFDEDIENSEQIAELIIIHQKNAGIPLFAGVDEEGGVVARLSDNKDTGVTHFPPMMEIGDMKDYDKAYSVGHTLGAELAALGFNVDFAPVADVLRVTGSEEIHDRSFGSDVGVVSKMVANVVNGLGDNNVCAAIKHFPGHGSAKANSHDGYSGSDLTAKELREKDFKPFEAGIKAGSDFVLVSHLTFPNVDKAGVPSTLSKVVITELLEGELKFQGIKITDSMEMGAIIDNYTAAEAALKAIDAGIDMILLPEDFESAYKAVLDAVKSGEIDEKRIDESVKRILTVKVEREIIEH